MRKAIGWMSVSLDGYFEGPGHQLDRHRIDEELHTYFDTELAGMSAFLAGRRSHELMSGFWPTADADPANPAPIREFAGIWRRMPKIVYSRTLTRADWGATIVRDVDPDGVNALKEQPGGDMIVGGAEITAVFRRLDLIDEYRIFVHPVLLGRGNLLFGPTGRPDELRLVETRAFGNGVVMLRHQR
ncbi:dihydrofolate reductase family protein [Micromonospora sp. S-DT3-3-22]|uniref:dihydrofolate reductase family protein n=1 Tax=Micromonospora sp. S-DT3-3-22 TaxID=2755359 RepID=UPI00188E5F2F|nr:dihydrofolate reductase family protein [Micromonospora sp. S-DT3-3-22]